MTPPDSSRYDSSPEYIRGLLAAIPLAQRETARRIGVSARYLRALAAGTRTCSYPVQFCLEALAAQFPEQPGWVGQRRKPNDQDQPRA